MAPASTRRPGRCSSRTGQCRRWGATWRSSSRLAGSAQCRSSRSDEGRAVGAELGENRRTSAKSAAWSVTAASAPPAKRPAAWADGARLDALEQVEPGSVGRRVGQVVAVAGQHADAVPGRFRRGRGPASSCRCRLRRRGERAGRGRPWQRRAPHAGEPAPAPGRRGGRRAQERTVGSTVDVIHGRGAIVHGCSTAAAFRTVIVPIPGPPTAAPAGIPHAKPPLPARLGAGVRACGYQPGVAWPRRRSSSGAAAGCSGSCGRGWSGRSCVFSSDQPLVVGAVAGAHQRLLLLAEAGEVQVEPAVGRSGACPPRPSRPGDAALGVGRVGPGRVEAEQEGRGAAGRRRSPSARRGWPRHRRDARAPSATSATAGRAA